MEIIRDVQSILDAIGKKKPKILGIDGIDGVGKTAIAVKLDLEFGYVRVSLDDHLEKNQKGYFNFIDYKKLKSKIELCKGKFLVIEGVLLQKVLNKIGVKPNFMIYMSNIVWVYDWLEDFQGKYYGLKLEEIIDEVEKGVNKLNEATTPDAKPYKMSGFRREIYEYTYAYLPWEKADLVYVES